MTQETDEILKQIREDIIKHVRTAFFNYHKRWVTTDPKELREHWRRFYRYLDLEIGE